MLTVVEAWIWGPNIDVMDQFEVPWKRRTRHRPSNISHQVCNEFRDLMISQTLFQYPIKRLIVRFREVSKPQNLYMKLSDRWAAEAPNKFKRDTIYQSRGFETSWDLMIRRLIGYWNGAQDTIIVISSWQTGWHVPNKISENPINDLLHFPSSTNLSKMWNDCMIMIQGIWSVVKAANKGHLWLYLVIHLLPPRQLDGKEFITGLVPVLSVKRFPSLTTSKTQPPQGTRQPGIESLQLRKYQTNPTWKFINKNIVLRLPTQCTIQG